MTNNAQKHLPEFLTGPLGFLFTLRHHILFAAAVFGAGAVIGTIMTDLPDAVIQSFFDLAQRLKTKNWAELTAFILTKNALAAMIGIYGGFLLGLFPFFAAFLNGMVMGRVVAIQPESIWMVLPHGIFELTAIFIAWGVGFWCAGWWRDPPRLERLQERAQASLLLFGLIVMPLLAVAAVIEATGIKLLTGT